MEGFALSEQERRDIKNKYVPTYASWSTENIDDPEERKLSTTVMVYIDSILTKMGEAEEADKPFVTKMAARIAGEINKIRKGALPT